MHVVTENAGRGGDQLRGVNEVLRTAGMDINRRTKLGESPGCAGVIEMDMTDENMPDVVSGGTNLPKRGYDIVKG